MVGDPGALISVAGPTGTDTLRSMWTSYVQDGEPDPDFLRRMSAPENELLVALPQNRILARTDDVAVGLTGLQVYTTGVAFHLVASVRPSVTETLDTRLNDVFWGHRREAAGGLLFGVEFADGRRAATIPGVGSVEERVIFHPGGGGGGDTSIDQSWWLSPVPPSGPLRLVLRCTDLGIGETVTELDGTAIARAVVDVVTLWPWEPPRHHDPGPPAPPADLPADSWFAR